MISILERMAALLCFSKFSSDLLILCMFECFPPTVVRRNIPACSVADQCLFELD